MRNGRFHRFSSEFWLYLEFYTRKIHNICNIMIPRANMSIFITDMLFNSSEIARLVVQTISKRDRADKYSSSHSTKKITSRRVPLTKASLIT